MLNTVQLVAGDYTFSLIPDECAMLYSSKWRSFNCDDSLRIVCEIRRKSMGELFIHWCIQDGERFKI